MLKNILFALVLLAAVASCGPKTGSLQVSEKGIEYQFHVRGDEKSAAVTDSGAFTFQCWYYNAKDSMFQTSTSPQNLGLPAFASAMQFPFSTFKDVTKMLRKGDSITIWVPVDSIAPVGQQLPPFIERGTKIKHVIKVIDVHSTSKDAQTAYEGLVNEYKKLKAVEDKKLQEADTALYIKLLASLNPPAKQTASGLHYVMENPGQGAAMAVGDTVKVHYTGTLMNGSKFDSSLDRGQPLAIPIGVGAVIPGWDEGIMLFKKGGKGSLFIPQYLAYGPNGAQVIPPYSALRFDIEVVDIIKPKKK